MKLVITEKQLQLLLSKNSEIEEQEGQSTTDSKSQGYPEVGKWESGVTRDGPGNQVTMKTKWSEIVKTIRGRANQLK
jgi:hypothetical protein